MLMCVIVEVFAMFDHSEPSEPVFRNTLRLVVALTITDLVVLIGDGEHTGETALLSAGLRTA